MKFAVLTLVLLSSQSHAANEFSSQMRERSGVTVVEETNEMYDNSIRATFTEDSKLLGDFEKVDANCGPNFPKNMTNKLDYLGGRVFRGSYVYKQLCVQTGVAAFCDNSSTASTELQGRDPSEGILWMLPRITRVTFVAHVNNNELYIYEKERGLEHLSQVVVNSMNTDQIIVRKANNYNKYVNIPASDVTCVYNRR